MNRLPMRLGVATLLIALAGCGTVTYQPGTPSNTRDGKCAGPDYNASDCVYLF